MLIRNQNKESKEQGQKFSFKKKRDLLVRKLLIKKKGFDYGIFMT